MEFGRYKDERAFFALLVSTAFVLKEKRGVSIAKRAGHRGKALGFISRNEKRFPWFGL